jgi:hypothetical protein
MREFLKKIYRAKISLMFYWNLGYSEFSTPIAVLRDIGITLTVLKILFKISFGIVTDILICTVTFLIFYAIGKILVANHMTQFQNKLSNSYNPELAAVRKIAEHLGINVDE